ncbi:hypothetical protein [Deinococcus soli (ex Cha et al. 2016)]|uniref:Uncharacterized protein n=2 Tax=Deinococcus soli (ex Cha et al. 2016) TaxID=1309411 RepID=A0AAE3XEB8_9DEIO|nr:hypothetical protein [Deinococcus soli (ex Cha et al. 2016)]MDR6218560.1 hypothetical protein [Deinococcus soli (ex Cha et al. 2016)]MDR6329300.1 hypothetical protein [Deinococcus soli (ex Cha et al. 2016)]MDR6751573.1 hypothetical protein [Deinococcus soli (ex Cha et al. 2016)]
MTRPHEALTAVMTLLGLTAVDALVPTYDSVFDDDSDHWYLSDVTFLTAGGNVTPAWWRDRTYEPTWDERRLRFTPTTDAHDRAAWALIEADAALRAAWLHEPVQAPSAADWLTEYRRGVLKLLAAVLSAPGSTRNVDGTDAVALTPRGEALTARDISRLSSAG